MTPEVNYELISNVLFANDSAFLDIDIKEAKVIKCLCKAAGLNTNITLCIDRTKAREYFDIIGEVIFKELIYKNRKAYLIRENISKTEEEEYNITSEYDKFINKLKDENENVLDGFRELIVLELREYIYNYENCYGHRNEIRINEDYCDQYYLIVNYFGYYEYYKSHTYDPTHFVLAPDRMDYDFARA